MISVVDDSVDDDGSMTGGEYGEVSVTGNSSCDNGVRWKKGLSALRGLSTCRLGFKIIPSSRFEVMCRSPHAVS
jgi:hypothetical protein